MKRDKFMKGLLIVLACMLFAGCTSRPAQEKEQTSSFKIMFWDEQYFFQQYGDLFAIGHPNVNIEVVNMNSIYNSSNGEQIDYEKAFSDFLEKEQHRTSA